MSKIRLFFAAVCWSISLLAAAVEDASASVKSVTPYEAVELITNGLLEIIPRYQDSYEENPEPLFLALDELLSERVDFEFIAYNVMGPYRKQASPQQRKQFAQTFRRDLIETYGRGLFVYGNQEVVLLPMDELAPGKRRATVYQEIRGNGRAFPLQYTMGLNKLGEWKVTNLVMNGINLGKTFRNQFLQRAQEFDGDIDRVIANWSAKPIDTQAAKQPAGAGK